MSDWIKKDGVKYFRESYLKLANKTAKRRADRIATLEAQLAEVAELMKYSASGDSDFVTFSELTAILDKDRSRE